MWTRVFFICELWRDSFRSRAKKEKRKFRFTFQTHNWIIFNCASNVCVCGWHQARELFEFYNSKRKRLKKRRRKGETEMIVVFGWLTNKTMITSRLVVSRWQPFHIGVMKQSQNNGNYSMRKMPFGGFLLGFSSNDDRSQSQWSLHFTSGWTIFIAF